MAKFGETIRRLRKARHLTIRAFAAKAGIDPGTVVRAEKQDYPKAINESTYMAIAAGFGLTTEQLDREWRAVKIPTLPSVRGIPVINRAPAGRVVNYEEHSLSGDFGMGKAYLDRGTISDPNAFAVVIVGDSMVPQLQEGDRAIFVPLSPDGKTHNGGKHFEDGDTAFVRLTPDCEDGGCTVGLLYRLRDGRLEIRKLNAAKYRPKIIRPEEIQSVSVLVEIRRPVKPWYTLEHEADQVDDSIDQRQTDDN